MTGVVDFTLNGEVIDLSQPQLLPLTEAAKALGIGKSTAYYHAARGTFPVPVLTVGSLKKVSRFHLEAFLRGEQPRQGVSFS